MGLNTSLIEDVKARRRTGQLSRPQDTSDRKALSGPNFAVIQALVSLLAQNGACFSTLNRTSESSAHKCNSSAYFYLLQIFLCLVNIGWSEFVISDDSSASG